MLFENRKQVDAEYLMLKYASKEDYDKVVKKPSFEAAKHRKKIDHVNGGRVKVNKGAMLRSHFMATDKKSNLKVEIRYAESNNSKIVGDRVIDVFEPRYVKAEGANFSYQHNIDLAVYMFLNANNELSPLRNPNNKTSKPKFEYVDTKKRAKVKMEAIDALGEAMQHSRNLSEANLVILAKGLGIKGIDKKEAYEVRADVMEYAQRDPKMYNEKVNTQLTYIEGRIWNLVDKGVIKLSSVGNVRRWNWVSGERSGEHIMDIPNVTQDARQALKNYFFSDINSHMNILTQTNETISVREKAERDLQALENNGAEEFVASPAYQPERVIGDALPAHLQSPSEEFLAPRPKYTEEEAIKELTDEFGNPPHHNKVKAWLRKMNAEGVAE